MAYEKDEQIKKQLNFQSSGGKGFMDDFENIDMPVNNLYQNPQQDMSQNQSQKNTNEIKEIPVDDDFLMIEEPQQLGNKKKNINQSKAARVHQVVSEMPTLKKSFYRNAELTRENMRSDAQKIGSKVWYKPTDAEKEKNEKINAAKAITKNATAYTLEIYNEMTYSKEQNQTLEDQYTSQVVENNPDRIALCHLERLDQCHFTAKMFAGAYMRKHIGSCYNLFYSYERINDVRKEVSPEIMERIEKYDEILKIFCKRFKEFCSNNHIDAKQVAGRDEATTAEEKITDEEYRNWLLLTHDAKALRKKDRMAALLQSQTYEQMPENIEEASQVLEQLKTDAVKTEDTEMEKSVSAIMELKRQDRISLLPQLNAVVQNIEKALTSNEIESPDILKEVRQRHSEYLALKKLTETELEVARLQLSNPEQSVEDLAKENKKLFDRLFEQSEDMRKIIKRQTNPQELIEETTVISNITKLTREEAMSTESDRKNFSAKMELFKRSKQMMELPADDPAMATFFQELHRLTSAYLDNNFYTAGQKAEMEAMRTLKNFVHAKSDGVTWAEENTELFAEFRNMLDQMTNGNLKEIDPNNLGSDEKYIDTIAEGRTRPKTTGDRKNLTSWTKTREDALKMFRTWDDPGDDAPLFAHEPTVNDLRQGKVSNCWMVSATEGIINVNPQIIKDAMRDNGDGTVTVRLFTSKYMAEEDKSISVPNYIRLKKEVPRLVTGGAIHTSGALWMQLLEKAAATIGYQKPYRQDANMGYDALWHGAQGDWIFALTGKRDQTVVAGNSLNPEPVFAEAIRTGEFKGISKIGMFDGDEANDFLHNETFKAELFNDMLHAKENGYMYTYGSKRANVPGMNEGHAYTVLSVGEENGERFVILRNPYANMNAEYKEDGSLYRTDSYVSSQMNRTGGQFKIKFDDFLKNTAIISRADLSDLC